MAPTKKKAAFYAKFSFAAASAAILLGLTVLGVIYLRPHNTDLNSDESIGRLATVLKNERRIVPRISGGLPWSPYTATRGDSPAENLQFDRAIKELQPDGNSPSSPSAKLALARLYLSRASTGDSERALALLRQTQVEVNESAGLLNDIGIALFELGKYAEGIDSFNKALQIDPDNSEAQFNRAISLERAGQATDARQTWEAFLSGPADQKWKEEARWRLSTIQK